MKKSPLPQKKILIIIVIYNILANKGKCKNRKSFDIKEYFKLKKKIKFFLKKLTKLVFLINGVSNTVKATKEKKRKKRKKK